MDIGSITTNALGICSVAVALVIFPLYGRKPASNPSPSPQGYVLGFMFDAARKKAVFIRKARPRWQAGLLNGVGGKIEAGESPIAAMRREFAEETGVDFNGWRQFALMDFDGGAIHCFHAFDDEAVTSAISTTDEKVEIHDLADLPGDTIANLRWLIPLALDPDMSASRLHCKRKAIPDHLPWEELVAKHSASI